MVGPSVVALTIRCAEGAGLLWSSRCIGWVASTFLRGNIAKFFSIALVAEVVFYAGVKLRYYIIFLPTLPLKNTI